VGENNKKKYTMEDFFKEFPKAYLCKLIRSRRIPPQEVEDTYQDFVVHVIERDLVARFNPDVAKFNTFIITCLSNFILSKKIQFTRRRNKMREVVSDENTLQGHPYRGKRKSRARFSDDTDSGSSGNTFSGDGADSPLQYAVFEDHLALVLDRILEEDERKGGRKGAAG